VTAVWFLWEDRALYIATGQSTTKGRNLAADQRMALCIESREPGREAGMSASGRAELVTGEAAVPIARRINAKYLTPAAMEHPVVGPAFAAMADLVVRLTPEKWISWDMGALGEQLLGPDAQTELYFQPTLN
jgi:hypothetical protein